MILAQSEIKRPVYAQLPFKKNAINNKTFLQEQIFLFFMNEIYHTIFDIFFNLNFTRRHLLYHTNIISTLYNQRRQNDIASQFPVPALSGPLLFITGCFFLFEKGVLHVAALPVCPTPNPSPVPNAIILFRFAIIPCRDGIIEQSNLIN